MSERKAVLLILSEQPNFSMDFTKLAQELITRKAIGFSANPDGPDEYIKDIVRHLEKSGYVTYDPEAETVTLLPLNVMRKFLESTGH